MKGHISQSDRGKLGLLGRLLFALGLLLGALLLGAFLSNLLLGSFLLLGHSRLLHKGLLESGSQRHTFIVGPALSDSFRYRSTVAFRYIRVQLACESNTP